MSSSRNEPCINRSVRANAPAKTTLPPVCEQEIIDVEAVPAEPIVPATASIIDTAPAVEAPIVETPVVDVPAVEAPASEVVFVKSPAAEVPTHVDTPKSPELSIFEQMFRQIQEMVEGNRQEIQSLKGELLQDSLAARILRVFKLDWKTKSTEAKSFWTSLRKLRVALQRVKHK